MNPYCERERQVDDAIRSGSADTEILTHARACPVCSEILLVSAFLRDTAVLAERELISVPRADIIWRKAQALARKKSIAKATQPIKIMTAVAYASVTLFAFWLATGSLLGQAFLDLSSGLAMISSSLDRLWLDVLGQTALLLGLCVALFFMALCSWLMLREDTAPRTAHKPVTHLL